MNCSFSVRLVFSWIFSTKMDFSFGLFTLQGGG